MISVVSPVFMAEKILPELVRRLIVVLESTLNQKFEIILVNDSSPDKSWNIIEQLCLADTRIKGIDLSKNFGQHYAIIAGLTFAQGEWIVVMDCDLQDLPEEIPVLLNKAKEGFDSVFAKREVRNDGIFKKSFSKLFYKSLSFFTETYQDPTVANFGIYNRKVIQSVLSMKDQIKFFPAMVQWVGFKKCYIPIRHAKRFEGKSSYSFGRLINLAIDVTLSFSDKPLRITVQFGLFLILISFIFSIVFLFKYFTGAITVLGYTSLMLSIWTLFGILILVLGLVGLYVGKTFEKVKDRPNFIVQKIINSGNQET